MHRRVLSIVALVFVACLAGAPSALAASTLTEENTGVVIFNFTAEAGKANNVTVAASKSSLTISDSADTITTSVPGCSGSGTNQVECFSLGTDFGEVFLELGDANDAVAASGSIEVNAFGAAGNDALSATGFVPFTANGGADNDTLNGGSGRDTLSGGEGADTVHGNGGNDAMSIEGAGDAVHGDAGNDFLLSAAGLFGGALGDGGPGVDTVFLITVEPEAPSPSYAVDLAAGSIGSGGPGGTLLGVENAITYQGADTVLGSAGPNRIDTVVDEDPLLAFLGEFGSLPTDAGDTVDPRGGPDFVTTGPGNDIVNLVDGVADRLDCGPGTDIVQADSIDVLVGCENVTLATVPPGTPPLPPPAPAADTAAPSCSLNGVARRYERRVFLRRGPRPRVSCNEAVTLEARLLTPAMAKRSGKKPNRRKSRRLDLGASVSRAGDLVLAEASGALRLSSTLRLKPLGRLRAQLGNRFKATLRIVARDRAGNATVLQRGVLVKPERRKRGKRGASA